MQSDELGCNGAAIPVAPAIKALNNCRRAIGSMNLDAELHILGRKVAAPFTTSELVIALRNGAADFPCSRHHRDSKMPHPAYDATRPQCR